MTYKQIEQLRETRMWLKDVIVPVVGAAAMIMTVPEARQVIAEKYNNAKEYVSQKFKKTK